MLENPETAPTKARRERRVNWFMIFRGTGISVLTKRFVGKLCSSNDPAATNQNALLVHQIFEREEIQRTE
jgi:hypothetical protein